MLPFQIDLQNGEPVSQQIIFAVKRAIFCGVLQPGEAFPSVRSLSQELRINPNTAHKVVAILVTQGLLEVRPGVGTVVAHPPPATSAQKSDLLGSDLERLTIEARQLGLELQDLIKALEKHWKKIPHHLKNPTKP